MAEKKTWSIVVVIGGRTLKATSDGTAECTAFYGDAKNVKRAKATALNKRLVRLGDIGDGRVAEAGYESPLALAATLYSIAPQSTYLLEAPDEVQDFVGMRNSPGITLSYDADSIDEDSA